MSQITMNEDGRDVHYASFPSKVELQFLSKEGKPLGLPQTMEFYTLASYILWVIDIAGSFPRLSDQYSEFAYFTAVQQEGTITLENQYIICSYTLVK